MKFTIERGDLLAAVEAARMASVAGGTIPILTNLKIEADTQNQQIRVTGTNLEMQITAEASAQVERAGAQTMSGAKLYDIARASPEGSTITFDKADGPQMSIRCGRTRYSAALLPPSDFPVFHEGVMDATLTIPRNQFRRLLDKGSFCAADKTPAHLVCTFLHTEGDRLRAVSLDGHRLTVCEGAAPGDFSFPGGAMLPASLVAVLRALIGKGDHEGEIEIGLTSALVVLEAGPVRLSAKLLDASSGGYVDYKRLFRERDHWPLTVDTDLFIAALRRTMIMADDATAARDRVQLDISSGQLVLSSRSMSAGDCREEIEAQYDGDDRSIAFAASRLMEFLENIETENAVILIPKGSERANYPVMPDGDSDWRGLITPRG